MNAPQSRTIRVRVDLTNPGQFFACCGLLELVDRLWSGAEGWFEDRHFYLQPLVPGAMPVFALRDVVGQIASAPLNQCDTNDDFGSPIDLGSPFDLRLDWWQDKRSAGDRLKVWAGSMRSVRIARAMRHALRLPAFQNEDLLDCATVVADPMDVDNKVEPYYFDARRGSNALSVDVGFSPDSLQMKTGAYPAVEFLCLVGLQRHRPLPSDRPRVFTYHTWGLPLSVDVTPVAVCGYLGAGDRGAFRFQNAFRTDQKKHKAFTPATPIPRS